MADEIELASFFGEIEALDAASAATASASGGEGGSGVAAAPAPAAATSTVVAAAAPTTVGVIAASAAATRRVAPDGASAAMDPAAAALRAQQRSDWEKAQRTKDAAAGRAAARAHAAPPSQPLHPFAAAMLGTFAPSDGDASAAVAAGGTKRKRAAYREAAGQVWEDKTLLDWPEGDTRLFVGNLGNECNDDTLADAFKTKYASFAMARVVRDKHTRKTKQFGFVSFMNPFDALSAMKEMQGKYVGNRPVIIRKSTWADRTIGKKKAQKKQAKRKRVKHGFFS
jgi:hypothetical protein